jgi:MarR family transcriptional regulator, organic hydroperoxide resistance regulator
MSYQIEETVGYALAQLCKTHRYAVDGALRAIPDHELRAGQEMLLLQLWREDGITQSQLVERLMVEPPTVTKMLQRIEGEGLVERRPDPDDARVSRVFLTAKGRALEQAVGVAWRTIDDQATAGLSLEERLLLRRLLVQMQRNLCRFSH